MGHRLLHVADLHLDRAFAPIGCQGELARRRRLELRDALRRAGAAAAEHDCSTITIGGDLYEHERADPETGRFLAELFASWQPRRVLLAPGNHDALLPGSLYARVEWPENVHLFTESRLRPLELEDGLTVWGLAHPDPAWQGDPLDHGPAGGDGGVHLALFHGADLGSRPEGKSIHGPFRAAAIRDRGFAAALCGHYHRRRLDSATGLIYPGTPEPLAFDEEGGRGPVLVDVAADGSVSMTGLDLNRWTAVTATADIEGSASHATVCERACDAALASCATLDPERTMLRIVLDGEVDPVVAIDLQTVEQSIRDATRLAVIRVRDRTTQTLDAAQLRAEPTVRGAFAAAALDAVAAASGDERELLDDAMRYGLQALAGVEVGLR